MTAQSNSLVSVIVPVYNGEKYLTQTINSITSQSYQNIEIIIVDDGSTDSTKKIITDLVLSYSNIKTISLANSGCPAIPKNAGIKVAKGDYLCFLDHDDLYDHGRTAQLVNALDSHPEWVAVFHDLRFIDDYGNHILQDTTYLSGPDFLGKASNYLTKIDYNIYECSRELYIYQSLFMGAPHTQSIMIAPNRLPKNYISFNPNFVIGEDIDLWIRISLEGKMGYINKVLSSYRQHSGSITKNQQLKLTHWLNMHINNYHRIKTNLTKKQIISYKTKISNGYSDLGYLHYMNNNKEKARESYLKSLQWHVSRENCIGLIKNTIPRKLINLAKKLSQVNQA